MAAGEGPRERPCSGAAATRDEHSRLLPPPGAAARNASYAIVLRCFFLSICMEIGNILVTVPLNQILEAIICRQMVSDHADGGGGVDLGCKNPNVQRELSFIRGWQLTFDVIPGLLTAMLYGLAAKRYGRQFILALSILGAALAAAFVVFVCSFPALFSPRLVWLSSAFTFIGGGVPVFNAMIFALLSDAVDESKRSTTFFYMNATPIGTQVLGGVAAFLLMRVSPWLCIYCGASFSAMATLIAFLFPASVLSGKFVEQEVTDTAEIQTLWGHLQQLRDAFLWFTRENFVTISLLSTLLVTTLGRSAPDILLQYITKRYGWTWSDASLLVSIHWFITLLLLAIILPSITQFLIQGKGLPSQRTDLLLARISIIASSIGAFFIGLSSNIPFLTVGLGLFTLSYAYPMLARSLLASVVDSRHTDVMYTTISIFEALGSIIAGPLLSASFRQGLSWGTDWLGLPFLLAGVLFGSAVVVLSYVRLASSFVSNV
ncbi:MFS transporter, putative [Cordyceps militaris CM01]|uniref:MFS transporter, putative n=1 Tax=Cordyceps militaris (strain CM01) TaxID=983644 RepID=G3JIC0_CORMM|nr:MFS transporter, putative [Cordyceps militaris CM01]EGX91870.1 MFS transporter, putative [Cordyceps militaris CM01]